MLGHDAESTAGTAAAARTSGNRRRSHPGSAGRWTRRHGRWALGAAVIAALLACSVSHAATYNAATNTLSFTVGTYETAPMSFIQPDAEALARQGVSDSYVVRDPTTADPLSPTQHWSGLAWRLLDMVTGTFAVSTNTSVALDIRVVHDPDTITSGQTLVDAMKGANARGIDIGLGSVTKTDERERVDGVEFSHTYFVAGQKMMVLEATQWYLQVWTLLKVTLLNPLLGRSLLLLVSIASIIGTISFIVEYWWLDLYHHKLKDLTEGDIHLRRSEDRYPREAFGAYDERFAWWMFCCCRRVPISYDPKAAGGDRTYSSDEDEDEGGGGGAKGKTVAVYDFADTWGAGQCDACCCRKRRRSPCCRLQPPAYNWGNAIVWAHALILGQGAAEVQSRLAKAMQAFLAFAAIFVFALVTASMAVSVGSQRDAQDIKSINDVAAFALPYACVRGSTGCRFMKDREQTDRFVDQEYWTTSLAGLAVEVPSLSTAVAKLHDGTVSAVVFDYPALVEWQRAHPEEKLLVFGADDTDQPFTAEDYGFVMPGPSGAATGVDVAVPANSQSDPEGDRTISLRKLINIGLLDVVPTPEYAEAISQFVPTDASAAGSDETGDDADMNAALLSTGFTILFASLMLFVCGYYQDRAFPARHSCRACCHRCPCACCKEKCCLPAPGVRDGEPVDFEKLAQSKLALSRGGNGGDSRVTASSVGARESATVVPVSASSRASNSGGAGAVDGGADAEAGLARKGATAAAAAAAASAEGEGEGKEWAVDSPTSLGIARSGPSSRISRAVSIAKEENPDADPLETDRNLADGDLAWQTLRVVRKLETRLGELARDVDDLKKAQEAMAAAMASAPPPRAPSSPAILPPIGSMRA